MDLNWKFSIRISTVIGVTLLVAGVLWVVIGDFKQGGALLVASMGYLTLGQEEQKNATLQKGLTAVEALIGESAGVSGLHLNGDIAPWQDLRTGGRFDSWLADFDAALERPNVK